MKRKYTFFVLWGILTMGIVFFCACEEEGLDIDSNSMGIITNECNNISDCRSIYSGLDVFACNNTNGVCRCMDGGSKVRCQDLDNGDDTDPVVNGDFSIAISHDGNQHDKDDYGAMPLAAALLKAAGLKNNVVHIEHSNHLGNNNSSQEKEMETSASGIISRFGYNSNIVFDCQTQKDAAKNNLKAKINAATSSKKLYILAAGPMETVWSALNAANASSRKNVVVVSHSSWNNNHNDTSELNHTWNNMKNDFEKDGVTFKQIKDQNKSNGDLDFNTPKSKWSWMQNSSDANLKWLYDRNKKSTFDVSDAGLAYWLLSGGLSNGCQNCGVNQAKNLLQ
jgi:hypothetical protein